MTQRSGLFSSFWRHWHIWWKNAIESSVVTIEYAGEIFAAVSRRRFGRRRSQCGVSLHFARSSESGPLKARFFCCQFHATESQRGYVGRKRKRRRRREESSAPSKALTAEVREAIAEWAGEAADVHGFQLWDVEVPQHGRWLIRVFVDRDDAGPGSGISVGECAEISRYMEAILDADERVAEDYVLEISSPGIERPLKKLHHLDRVVGEDVELVVREPIAGKNKVVARLLAHDDGVLTIELDEESFDVDWDNVARAKLKYDFSRESGEQ